jgi:hypothetical protein
MSVCVYSAFTLFCVEVAALRRAKNKPPSSNSTKLPPPECINLHVCKYVFH